ncbi:TolC family outer membrane protein [Herbaspirillum autotrophicum]|uniref:TolC family outer membrane protein n=1 Tax=Herbaspirillum autotrophicum TaxID=180195 RepID=UPI00067CF04B|nr:TolC family outer membrane protein [Herbaspirillum autotrophicum]
MRQAIFVTLIAGTLYGALSSQVNAADLIQVYQQALANDPVYASARYALTAGEEKSIQGRAGLLPSVNVGGTYSRLGDSMNNSTHTYGLQLTQPLFRVANWEAYQQSKLQVAGSEVQFEQARQDLILRVGQAYFDVLATQDVLTFVRANKVAIAEQLASAKRNFEVGTATITDTNEAQARYDLANAQEIAAQNDLELAQNRLQQIVGQTPAALSILRKDVQLSLPQPAQIDTWVSSAEQQNYGVVAQQIALEIAKRDIKRNRAGHYPTVDLVAGRNYNNQNFPASPTQTYSVASNSIGVQWNIPLFSGFAVDSKVNESISLADKARSDLESARRTAILNARQAYLGVSNGLSQVKAYEAAEISSLSSLESNRLGYQVGVRINIDVLNAQQQLFSTRRDLAKARYDTLMNGLKLKSAAGTLKEEDLALVNQLLVPPTP